MARTVDRLIAVTTLTLALFGLGTGSFIYAQFPGAPVALALLGLSLVGGLLGVAKLRRTRRRSGSRSTTRGSGYGRGDLNSRY